jgi:hypothetical protein
MNKDLQKQFTLEKPELIQTYHDRFSEVMAQLQPGSNSIEISTIVVSLFFLAQYHIWKPEVPRPIGDVNSEIFKSVYKNHKCDGTNRENANRFIKHYSEICNYFVESNQSFEKFNQLAREFASSLIIFAEFALKPSIDMSVYKKLDLLISEDNQMRAHHLMKLGAEESSR